MKQLMFAVAAVAAGAAMAVESNIVGYDTVTVDADDLRYISSAGLRVILRLRKSEPSLSVINAGTETYSIFKMTGLEKKLSTEREKARKARRDQVVRAISGGDYAAAERVISEMLVEKPNGATPLNLRAMMEARQGKFREAERTLDQAIMSNPRSYHAYYNMADLIIKMNPSGKIAAKRYYDTGRAMGGPVDEKLEAALK